MAASDQDVTHSGDAGPGVLVREGSYGTQVFEVEPGGAEFIPLNERHGRPLQLFWTWTSPNMEFATIFVGMLAVVVFGLGFWEAALALILGSAIGGITQGILSLRGPKYGVPQMVLSRLGFGYWGNALPAGLNSVTAGIGWFAVNSVSGAFALNALTHMPQVLCLLIIVVVQVVVAFFGYNLVHAFERYAFPVLTVIFLIASGVILSKAHPGAVHQQAHVVGRADRAALGVVLDLEHKGGFAGDPVLGIVKSFDLGPLKVQPAEFAKFTCLLALAAFLAEDRTDTLNYARFVKGLLLVGVPTALVIVQPGLIYGPGDTSALAPSPKLTSRSAMGAAWAPRSSRPGRASVGSPSR